MTETKTVTRNELNNLVAQHREPMPTKPAETRIWTVGLWRKIEPRHDYTHDIGAAMQLVSEMRKTRYVVLHLPELMHGGANVKCELLRDGTFCNDAIELAICRAFLYLKTGICYEVSD